MNSRPKNSAKSDYEHSQLLRRATAPCRPAAHTVDEAVRGPALVSWVSSRVSADCTLALMTPSLQPTSARPEWAGHPQVTSEVSTRQPTEGLHNWKRPHRQVFWHLSVCSVVNEARAPRLATRDQPSPSKPVHPQDVCIIARICKWAITRVPTLWARRPPSWTGPTSPSPSSRARVCSSPFRRRGALVRSRPGHRDKMAL